MIHLPSSCLLWAGFAGFLLVAPVHAQRNGTPVPASGKAKAAGQGERKLALPIAVVDISLVSPHTKAMRSGLERLGQMTQQYNQTLKSIGTRIEDLDAEVRLMKPSPERWEKQIELSALGKRQETARKIYDQALNLEGGKMQAAAYREVEAAIAELAKKKGILLVLRKRTHQTVSSLMKPGAKANDAEKLRAEQRQRSDDRLRDILYAAPAVDLTEDLIKYLKG